MFTKEIDHQNTYTDGFKNYKKWMVMTHFILSSDLEEHYVSFLKEMVSELEPEWNDFQSEILEEIEQYQITDEEINEVLTIKIPS